MEERQEGRVMSMTPEPMVSVVIPVFNGANFMREAIDSALAQSYPSIEVLVVNDGSDDCGATETIARSYGDSIRYIAKKRGGVASALNEGLRKMKGDFFSWLSHDDLYKPDKIQRQIEFLKSNGGPGTIIYGGYELIDSQSRTVDIVDISRLHRSDDLAVPLFPVFRGLINGCTLLVHKRHFERVGYFNENLPTTQDYEMWFRLFRFAEAACCPGVSVRSRLHAAQTSRTDSGYADERERLWAYLLDNVTRTEMAAMEDEPYHFYVRTANFLKTHDELPAAEAYARRLAAKEAGRLDGITPPAGRKRTRAMTMSSGGSVRLASRLLFHLRHEGIRATYRKLVRKLL